MQFFAINGQDAVDLALLARRVAETTLVPAMIVMGLGATLCVGTAGTAAVSTVPASRAGVAEAPGIASNLWIAVE